MDLKYNISPVQYPTSGRKIEHTRFPWNGTAITFCFFLNLHRRRTYEWNKKKRKRICGTVASQFELILRSNWKRSRYYYNRAAIDRRRAIKLKTTKYSYFIDEWRAITFKWLLTILVWSIYICIPIYTYYIYLSVCIVCMLTDVCIYVTAIYNRTDDDDDDLSLLLIEY